MNQYGDRENEVLAHKDLLDAYLNYVRLNRTEETAILDRAKVRPWLRYVDTLNPAEWTRLKFEAFLGAGKAGTLPGQIKRWSVRSTQLYLTALTLFGRWCQDHDVGCPAFWQGIKKPRSVVKEAKFFVIVQVVGRHFRLASRTRTKSFVLASWTFTLRSTPESGAVSGRMRTCSGRAICSEQSSVARSWVTHG